MVRVCPCSFFMYSTPISVKPDDEAVTLSPRDLSRCIDDVLVLETHRRILDSTKRAARPIT